MDKIIEEIKRLLETDTNSAALSRATGVSRQLIDKYKNGKSRIDNMTIETARELYNYIKEMEMMKNKAQEIKAMSIEEFYMLDEVSIESDGFYYKDSQHEVSEMVEAPEEAFTDSSEYSDHMHPAYKDAWIELKEKVEEAYEG